MKKTFLSLMLVLCLLASGIPAAGAEAGPVTLRFITSGVNYWEAAMDPIIEAYNALNPNTQVKVEYYAQDQLFENIEIALGAGSTDYDIIAVDSPKVAEYADKGYLHALDAYLTTEELAEFQRSTIVGGSYKDVLYALPMQAGISCLYYNKTLLDAAGVTLRENTADNRLTFEELIEMGQQVQQALDPNGTEGISPLMFGQINLVYSMLQIPTSMGGEAIGEDDTTLDGVVNSEAWLNAAQWYQQMLDDKSILAGSMTVSDTANYFQSGKIVFLLNSFSSWGRFQQNEQYELEMAYNPVFADYGIAAAPTGSWTLGVSAYSQNKDAAADFVKYFCAGDGHEMWVKNGGAFSAKQTDVDAALADPDANYGLKIALSEAATIATPRPGTPYYSVYETVINEYWANLASGEPVEDCVQTAIDTYAIYVR